MPLKLGTTDYMYLWNEPLKNAFQDFADIKLQYVEIMSTPPSAWPGDLNNKEMENLKKRIRSYDFEVVALNPTFGDLNIASPRSTIRKATIDEIKRLVDMAVEFNCNIVILAPGKRPNPKCFASPPIDVIKKYSKNGVIECVKYAEDNGVIIGLEAGPSFYIETSEQLKNLIEDISLESLKAVFDSSNLSIVEPLDSALENLKNFLCHVHLADNDCESFTKLPIGKGTIDFNSLAKKLNSLGYKGCSVIEFWYPNDPHGELIRSKNILETMGWKT